MPPPPSSSSAAAAPAPPPPPHHHRRRRRRRHSRLYNHLVIFILPIEVEVGRYRQKSLTDRLCQL